jgi:hypothetical protein
MEIERLGTIAVNPEIVREENRKRSYLRISWRNRISQEDGVIGFKACDSLNLWIISKYKVVMCSAVSVTTLQL